jgi:iron-sulfur cluster assembly accessory protein
LVKSLDKGDVLLEENGAKVLIDEVSIPYLEGSVIDYKNDLIGQSFEIQNPNATSSCGCGTSFSM